MHLAEKVLVKIVKFLNEIAGWFLALCMVLVTVNVILRKVFSTPILGAYEWVSILTALSIAFGLAYCSFVDGHIMIDFIVEKFSHKVQKIIAAITGIISVAFLSVTSYALIMFALKLIKSGEVTPTTQIPFYIFVFVIGFCFILLTATVVLNLIKAVNVKTPAGGRIDI